MINEVEFPNFFISNLYVSRGKTAENHAQCDYLTVDAVAVIGVTIVVSAKTFKVFITAAGTRTLAGRSGMQNGTRKHSPRGEKRIRRREDGRRERGRVNYDGRPASEYSPLPI